jgi:hypothetical protein
VVRELAFAHTITPTLGHRNNPLVARFLTPSSSRRATGEPKEKHARQNYRPVVQVAILPVGSPHRGRVGASLSGAKAARRHPMLILSATVIFGLAVARYKLKGLHNDEGLRDKPVADDQPGDD